MPKLTPTERTERTSWWSGATVRSCAIASLMGADTTLLLRSATMTPYSPLQAQWAAAVPKFVASTRSKAVGEPPRCRWPRTVTRVSTFLDRLSDHGAYPTQLSRVGAFLVHRLDNPPTVGKIGAFGNADDAEALMAGIAFLDDAKQGIPGEKYFGQQDDIGSAGCAAGEGNPAGMALHDLNHHDPVVR